jgi:16S rRNA processing protein RimM
LTLVTAGRVGRPHGHDGSFYVDGASAPLAEGSLVTVGGGEREVARRAGTDQRPLVRLAGLDDPRELRGEPLLVEAELDADEWLAGDLVGCEVEGAGRVKRVLDGPSCGLLELDDGTLVPFVADAVLAVDVPGRKIQVDLEYLGVE